MYRRPVKEYPNRQYVTGEQHQPGTFLPDSISQWVDPLYVIENADHFHPCLVQIARDLMR